MTDQPAENPATTQIKPPEPPAPPESPEPCQRAYRSWVAWLTLLLVVVTALAVDLGSKSYTFNNLASRPVVLDLEYLLSHPNFNPIPRDHVPVAILPWNLLDARLVINRGAVFGLGQDKRIFFILFTVGAIGVAVLLFARWTKRQHHWAHVAFGLILAGGMGNLYDRWTFGVVRDFLHLFPEAVLPFGWKWPGGSPDLFPWVFNGADVMLLTGMLMLMIHINRVEARREKKKETEEQSTPQPTAAPSVAAIRAADAPEAPTATDQ